MKPLLTMELFKLNRFKKIYPFFFIFFFIITSCSPEEIEPEEPKNETSEEPKNETSYDLLTKYEKEIVGYFKEIALGFEFGNATEVTRKWNSDMKIFVGGDPNQELLDELQVITQEINALATDGFSMEVVNDSLQSNFYIFFGSGAEYASIYPSAAQLFDSNWGLFSIYFNSEDEIYKGIMYVDIYRPNMVERKHLLREELTQALGLAKDSGLYKDSIFQQSWTSVTSYSNIDEQIIRLLYHPKMKTGLSAASLNELLANIILDY